VPKFYGRRVDRSGPEWNPFTRCVAEIGFAPWGPSCLKHRKERVHDSRGSPRLACQLFQIVYPLLDYASPTEGEIQDLSLLPIVTARQIETGKLLEVVPSSLFFSKRWFCLIG